MLTIYYNHWFKSRFIRWKAKDLVNERYMWKFVMWQTSQDFIQNNCFSIGKMQIRLLGFTQQVKHALRDLTSKCIFGGGGTIFELLFFPMCSHRALVGSQPMIFFFNFWMVQHWLASHKGFNINCVRFLEPI